MKSNAFVLAFSISSMAASVAYAQSAPTPNDFGSNHNYLMGGTSCSALQNVKVSLFVTEDIVAGSSLCGGVTGDNGFSLQLNANSPNTIQGSLAAAWQQYIIIVGQSPVAAGLNNLTGQTQIWANTKGDAKSIPDQAIPVPGASLPNVTIPAGYTLTWTFATDPTSDKVTKVTYAVTDPQGVTGSNTQSVASNYSAPIADLELNIVGQPGGCNTTFSSGAGTITYSSTTTFSAQRSIPSCAISQLSGGRGGASTGETSNSGYGMLPSGSSTSFRQEFWSAPWQRFSTAGQPEVAHGFTPTLGVNTVTLAPSCEEIDLQSAPETVVNLAVLTDGTQDGQGDFPLAFYSAIDGSGGWASSSQYYQGLAAGPPVPYGLAAWTAGGQLYYDVSASPTYVSTATGVDSFAQPSTVFPGAVTSNGYNCLASTPGGWCAFLPSNTSATPAWSESGEGAYQVTTDTVTGHYFLLDENQRVWENQSYAGQPDSSLTNALCNGGGTLPPPVLIAARDWIVYALANDAVYEINAASGSCWSSLGFPIGTTAFKSIATDYGCGHGVWASGGAGAIWYYE